MVVRALYLKMGRGEISDQMHNYEVTNTSQMGRGEISDQMQNCGVTYTSQLMPKSNTENPENY
jgi:hypothetical protein